MSEPRPLIVFGAGGQGREVMALVEALNAEGVAFEPLGYLDDDVETHGEIRSGYPVLGGLDWIDANQPEGLCAAFGVGAPGAKKRVHDALTQHSVEFPRLVHPRAEVSRHVSIGQGVVISAGCVVSVDVELADFVHVNPGTRIGHDSRVGRYANLNWGVNVSGNVTLEPGTYVGSGATILQGLTIGAGCVIGAGATVIKDLAPNTTAVGVPARGIKELPPWGSR